MIVVQHDGKSVPRQYSYPIRRDGRASDVSPGLGCWIWPDNSRLATDVVSYIQTEVSGCEAPLHDRMHGQKLERQLQGFGAALSAAYPLDHAPPAAVGAPVATRASILDAARVAVLRDRAASHGPVETSFGTLAEIWSARLGVAVTPSQVAIMMIDLKGTRAWANPAHGDNWVDICGYGACGGEIAATGAASAAPVAVKFVE